MFHVRDNFKNLVGRAAAREFNRIAAFLNNLCAGDFMNVERPDCPTADTPPRVALRYDALASRFMASDAPVTAPASTDDLNSGAPSNATGGSIDYKTFGSPSQNGALVLIACRSVNSNGQAKIYFRPFKISGDGRIYSIGGEEKSVTVYAV